MALEGRFFSKTILYNKKAISTMSGMEDLEFLALFSMYGLQLSMMRLVEPGLLSGPSTRNSLLEKRL